jgi:hypothetical protein
MRNRVRQARALRKFVFSDGALALAKKQIAQIIIYVIIKAIQRRQRKGNRAEALHVGRRMLVVACGIPRRRI